MTEIKEFDDLLNLGRVTKTVDIAGHKIVLSTVSSLDYSHAMERVPDNTSTSKRLEIMQREMIASAIVSIDGKTIGHDEKIRILSMGQLGLSNLLYSEYVALIEEQGKILEDAKKNSSQVTAP